MNVLVPDSYLEWIDADIQKQIGTEKEKEFRSGTPFSENIIWEFVL